MPKRQSPPGEAVAVAIGEDSWVTVSEAVERSGASKQAIRNWYRKEVVPSRVVEGAHGPMRLVFLPAVHERVAWWKREARPKREPKADATTAEVVRLAERAADAFERLAAEHEERVRLESRISEMQGALEAALAENDALKRRLARAARR